MYHHVQRTLSLYAGLFSRGRRALDSPTIFDPLVSIIDRQGAVADALGLALIPVVEDRVGPSLSAKIDAPASCAGLHSREPVLALYRVSVIALLQLRQGGHHTGSLARIEIPPAHVGAQNEVHGVCVVVQVSYRQLDAQFLSREIAVAPVDHGPASSILATGACQYKVSTKAMGSYEISSSSGSASRRAGTTDGPAAGQGKT